LTALEWTGSEPHPVGGDASRVQSAGCFRRARVGVGKHVSCDARELLVGEDAKELGVES
jgi:hypothetical protein